MIFKYIDFLSPQITLYHQGFLSHSSIISGIISIISLVIIISFGVYYSLDLIKRESPKAFSFNLFVNNNLKYPMIPLLFFIILILLKQLTVENLILKHLD